MFSHVVLKLWPWARQQRSADTGQMGLAALLLLLGLSLVVSIGVGTVHLSPAQTVAILLNKIGIWLPVASTPRQEAVLLTMRLPRAALCMIVGAGLSMAGAAMQGVCRNPLADPGLVGVSSGAAMATAGVIWLGGFLPRELDTFPGILLLPIAAVAGALLTMFLIYHLSHLRGHAQGQGHAIITTMLLAGIAVNAIAPSVTGFMTFVANDVQLRGMTFWSLGSLGHASWEQVAAVAPFIGVACVLLPRCARALNAMLLGEAEAQHLGVDVRRLARWTIALAALAVGASVAVAGVIGFVGLIGPHLARLLLGADNRVVLPGAALLGATLLLVADLFCRTLAAPSEVPIGLVTALMGAPFLLWLVVRGRGRTGA